MCKKFHVSPDLFNGDITNIYHPDSIRKLGHIVKDKYGNSTVQTTDDGQVALFADEGSEF